MWVLQINMSLLQPIVILDLCLSLSPCSWSDSDLVTCLTSICVIQKCTIAGVCVG